MVLVLILFLVFLFLTWFMSCSGLLVVLELWCCPAMMNYNMEFGVSTRGHLDFWFLNF
jgi:hypothetical protein